MRKTLSIALSLWVGALSGFAQQTTVPTEVMKKVYNEIKTPFKYGIAIPQPDSSHMVDCPTVFREGNTWYMTYIVFNGGSYADKNGRGYETWLAESSDLLHWNTKGRILSFTENTWDASQKAGYVSLVDIKWGGSCKAEKFEDKYWLTYIGGETTGYEAGKLSIGLANTATITKAKEWNRISKPILRPDDKDARWFEKGTLYKSTIIHDRKKTSGYPFVMYYNANGGEKANYESIGMAVSKDMLTWERKGNDPLITRRNGICGDAQIVKIKDVYVMFYFGAGWKPGAFDRFACSYDLVHWTDWDGEDLIAPSVDYDKEYAHKPWVLKYKGVVYHFYCAVGKSGRVIAVATSKDLTR